MADFENINSGLRAMLYLAFFAQLLCYFLEGYPGFVLTFFVSSRIESIFSIEQFFSAQDVEIMLCEAVGLVPDVLQQLQNG